MRIALINQFYPPAQAPTGLLLADLAGELADRGHEVTVVASAAGYGAGAGQAAPGRDSIRVVRLGRAGRHCHGFVRKLFDYLAFFPRALRAVTQAPQPPDAMVCMTTPPFCGLIGAYLRKRRGIPYVLWCMDLYPEALFAHGSLRPWLFPAGLLARLARCERGSASAVVALGPDMRARLAAGGGASRIEEIPVWSNLGATPALMAEARALRRARGWADDDIVLLYSGNMGRAHRAGEFAALAACLRNGRPCCRFVFAGDGPRRAEWARRWAEDFEFLPPVSGEACAAHLLSADVHLGSQQPDWEGVVVPSKFQAACALGRPVVFAGPAGSAPGLWITNADAGWLLPPGDAAACDAAARGIRDERQRAAKGANARRLFEQSFTRAGNCATLAAMIEQIAGSNP